MDSETDPRVLRGKLKKAREKIASLREKNALLEATIKELQRSQTAESSSEAEDSESEELPAAFYSRWDGCYFCVECGFEVCDWVCQNGPCSQQHAEDPDFDDIERLYYYSSMSTEDEPLISDRQMAPRGCTPILQDAVDASEVHRPLDIPAEQYSQLIGRGASREMIIQFQLYFEEQNGIFAWADQDLFDMYSSSVMAEGDRWKIALGRQIVRNYDDLDGSMFIEELLDEILAWPHLDQWETVKDGPTGWITRPKTHDDNAKANDTEDAVPDNSDHEYSDADELEDGQYGEDLQYEAAQALLSNPLQLHNEYESSESGDDGASDVDELMLDAEGVAVQEIDTDTDWSAVDPTEKEAARRDLGKPAKTDGDAGVQDNEGGEDSTMQSVSESGSEADEIDSDEPGSDWDSNDGIE